MEVKSCYNCRTEVHLLAKVCPSCHTKLGRSDSNGLAKKYTHPLTMVIAIFLGIALFMSIVGSISQGSQPAPQNQVPTVDAEYGIIPDLEIMPGKLYFKIKHAIKDSLHDPDSFDDFVVSNTVYKMTSKISGKKLKHWRIPVEFRAKNGFGGVRLYRGSVWVLNDTILKIDVDVAR